MVEFNFYLSDDDFDRLYALKDKMGYKDLTGNQFAELLLSRYLKELHPNAAE